MVMNCVSVVALADRPEWASREAPAPDAVAPRVVGEVRLAVVVLEVVGPEAVDDPAEAASAVAIQHRRMLHSQNSSCRSTQTKTDGSHSPNCPTTCTRRLKSPMQTRTDRSAKRNCWYWRLSFAAAN